jgi:phage terminase small subunit
MRDKLTEREKAFVDHWLITLNGTQAIMETNKNVKRKDVAAAMAVEYLRKPKVQEYIRRKRVKLAKKVKTSQEEVLLGLINLAAINIKEICEWEGKGDNFRLVIKPSQDLSPHQADAIQEITETVFPNGTVRFKVKLFDKVKAREALARHLGMFAETLNIPGLETIADMLAADPFENTEHVENNKC